jgi:hypothetical protein
MPSFNGEAWAIGNSAEAREGRSRVPRAMKDAEARSIKRRERGMEFAFLGEVPRRNRDGLADLGEWDFGTFPSLQDN